MDISQSQRPTIFPVEHRYTSDFAEFLVPSFFFPICYIHRYTSDFAAVLVQYRLSALRLHLLHAVNLTLTLFVLARLLQSKVLHFVSALFGNSAPLPRHCRSTRSLYTYIYYSTLIYILFGHSAPLPRQCRSTRSLYIYILLNSYKNVYKS
jgi:hypothetical protein